MITTRPLLTILVAGSLFFLVSFSGGFYWATSPAGEKKAAPATKNARPAEKQAEQAPPGKAEPGTTSSTEPRAGDWESFLSYEGERTEMLGIKKTYGRVNFRRGPGTDYEIIQTPAGGTLLAPLDFYESWYRARLRDGTIGWIHRSLIRKIKTPRPVVDKFRKDLPPLEKSLREQIPDSYFELTRITVKEDLINLRRGPGEQFTVSKRAYRGQVFRLLAKKDDWIYAKTHLGDRVWIYSELVDVSYAIPERERREVLVENTEIWPTPDHHFQTLTRLDGTSRLEVLETQENWLLVRTESGEIGWMNDRDIVRELSRIRQFPGRRLFAGPHLRQL